MCFLYFHRYQVFYGDMWETELWLSLRLVWSSMCWNRPELSKLICFIHIWVFRNYLWYEKQHRLLLLQRPTKHLYLLRRHPKICNGQVDALDSKLYPVLLTVTRPIMTTSVDSAHVKTLQVGVSFWYYFIIKLLFFSSSLSVTLLFLSPTFAFNFLFLSFESVFIVKQLFWGFNQFCETLRSTCRFTLTAFAPLSLRYTCFVQVNRRSKI